VQEHFETQYLTFGSLKDKPSWIMGELARLAFQNAPLALTASVLCAFLTVILLWQVVDNRMLIGWLGAICVVTMLSLMLQQSFEHAENRHRRVRLWHRLFIISSFSAGCLWGALSVFLFPVESVLHQSYLAFILAGVCAGAVTVYSTLPGAFPAFAVSALVPFSIQIFLHETGQGHLLAGLVGVFLLIVTRSAIEARRNVRELLDLQIQNTELTEALHHRATHDSLVDLANHGEFNRQLHRLAVNNRRDGNEYSLIFIDLDMFKEVNDTGGHAAGDLILKAVAKILKERIRSGDTAARVGGDEFALLLDGCGEDRAIQIAEEIRHDIADLEVEYDGQKFGIQASIGVTYGRTNKHSATSMLKSADVACYMAKEEGRNQVRCNPASDLFQTTDRFKLAQVPGTA
jgi:diguanylate cyclase (GGDEF)-like protein